MTKVQEFSIESKSSEILSGENQQVNYERLPDVVEIHGVGIPHLTAKLIVRTDKKAMYYRWDGVYEVFRIIIEEPKKVFETCYPRREVYPINEDFGKTAWSYNNEKLARDMYNRI
jgi:hypothetical protein